MLTLTQGRGRSRPTEKAAVFGEKIRARVPTVARPVTSADRPYSFVPPFTPRPPVSSRPPWLRALPAVPDKLTKSPLSSTNTEATTSSQSTNNLDCLLITYIGRNV